MSDFIDTAIQDTGVSLHTEPTDKANCFKCIMTSAHGDMRRTMTMREGCGAPALGDLMLYYALRAQDISQYDDILEWSDENERDLNDPKTIPDFKQLVQDKTDLRLLLSEPAYQKMMAGLEIHQAISCARPG